MCGKCFESLKRLKERKRKEENNGSKKTSKS